MKIDTRSHFTPVSITLETKAEVISFLNSLRHEVISEFCIGDDYKLLNSVIGGLSIYVEDQL